MASKKEDPSVSTFKIDYKVRRALRSWPRFFAIIALPIIEKYGDEAKELIYKAIYENSYKNGLEMAKKAKDTTDLVEFERLSVEGLLAAGYNTPGFDDPARHWSIRTKKKCVHDLRGAGGCGSGIPDVWKELGIDDETIQMLGKILCEPLELGYRKGFNKNIEFKMTKLAPRGDPYCEWCEELKE